MLPKFLSIALGANTIEYRVERSLKRKKTISLTINRQNEIVVRAPTRTPVKQINQLVEEKSRWILKKLSENGSLAQREKNYVDGENFKFLGFDYPLVIKTTASKRGAVRLRDGCLIIHAPPLMAENQDWLKIKLRRWYLIKADAYIRKIVERVSLSTGLKPEIIRIKNLKRSWGICSGKKVISFNWRLIMAPADIVEYIIVHELCHLKHMNHSKEFYALVESIQPDYRQRRKALRYAALFSS